MRKPQLSPPAIATDYTYADALRALAIFGIVVVHAAQYTEPQLALFHVDVARALTYLATLGVACLFVLSGFLLAPPFIAGLLDPSRPTPDPGRFWLKRFLRIYPLYAVAVLACTFYEELYGIVGMRGYVPISLPNLVAHLLFLQDVSPAWALSIDAPLWTMPVDVAFYVALPPFFAIVRRCTRGLTPEGRAVALRCILLALALASVLYRAAVVHAHPAVAERFVDQVIWLKNLAGMASAFALGILVALEMRTTFARRRARPRAGAATIALGVALALGHALTRRNSGHVESVGAVAGFATYDAVAALAAATIVCGFAIGRFRAPVASAGSARWQAAAALSYAAYLFHEPILNTLLLIRVASPNLAFLLQLTACAAVLVPAAALLHRYVEQPFLTLKARIRA
jgi:peptidoglycan/LPS O-acetylase OafA/YrhL